MPPPEPTTLALVSVAGPGAARLDLHPPGPLTIGRRRTHDLILPDPISRDHARLFCEPLTGSACQWFIMDTASKHGTRLNGVKLEPDRRYPIQSGDLIELQPFTFQLIDPTTRARDATIVQTDDDARIAASSIAAVRTTSQSRRQLELLLQCAERIHAADDAHALAEAVLDAAVIGTGYPNAALLGPMTADGAISILGNRGDAAADGKPRLSRSLIHEASAGLPARMGRAEIATPHQRAASMISLGIDEALCVPIFIEKTLAGFLYLDSRNAESQPQRPGDDAVDFATGIARLAAMAIANLKRAELQQRLLAIQSDVAAAAEAQRWVLPPRQGRYGRVSYIGESRPGRHVSGDFFDVIRLDDHRVALSLGDVTGKGMEASVLMTATQGYLHAALLEHSDISRAVCGLNSYIQPRCDSGRFVTLWTGILDPQTRTLTYVDAGHGYAMLVRSDGTTQPLNAHGGIPIGIDGRHAYLSAEASMEPGDCVLIVSDGFAEQPAPGAAQREEFGLSGVLETLASVAAHQDAIEALFAAVLNHADGGALADDATALLARFESNNDD